MSLREPKRRKLSGSLQSSSTHNRLSNTTLITSNSHDSAVFNNDRGASEAQSRDDSRPPLDISEDGSRSNSEDIRGGDKEPLSKVAAKEFSNSNVNGQYGQNVITSRPIGTKEDTSVRTSIFKARVEELLQNNKPKYDSKTTDAKGMVWRLKEIFEQIPDRGPYDIQKAEQELLELHKIAIPFPEPKPPSDAQYKLAFTKPSAVNVIGSYVLKTATRTDGKLSVDMVVFMPPNLFSEKDYLDYRYFHKRAYYLACLCAGIQQKHNLKFQLTFQHHNGNSLLPVLVVHPHASSDTNDFALSKSEVVIMPAIARMIFPLNKMLPHSSCVRPKESTAAERVQRATPFYNSSLLMDCCVTSYLKLLHGSVAKNSAYRDACILGRIWLKKRGLGSSIQRGGFGNFEWTALLAVMLQGGGVNGKPLISNAYDNQQLFRTMLQFLATRDLINQPLFWEVSANLVDSGTNGMPMVIDGARGINLLFKMTSSSYKILQQEARITATAINRGAQDLFDNIFKIKTNEPCMKYDLNVEITVSSRWTSDRVQKLIRQGLGDRIEQIVVCECAEKPWPVCSYMPRNDWATRLTAGLILHPLNAARVVDRGPAAEDKAAATAFREFWGGKAELRRFNDGAILESLIWTKSESPASVIKEIVLYVLSRHIGQEVASASKFIGDDFEEKVASACSLLPDNVQNTTLGAYKILERDIRALEGLPLHVRQVFLTNFIGKGNTIDSPAAVVLQFEGSAKWPDKLDAIQITKIAFLLRLAELLHDSVKDILAQVGLENEQKSLFNKPFLDVEYPSGAKFRIRIHHDREQDLIERYLKGEFLIPYERVGVASCLVEFKRIFLRRPLHTQVMQTLSTRFPAFSSTVRIVKAWFNAHLLGPHFAIEAIEIIVARTFLQSSPWPSPSSAMTAFLRVLLFLSRWDWQNEPLHVDYTGTMKLAEMNMVYTRFEAWRKIDPLLNRVALFIATSNDEEGTIWTEHKPSKVVANRMSSLARAAVKIVREHGLEVDFASLFKSPLADYDFILHLNTRYTRDFRQKRGVSRESQFKNLSLELGYAEPLTEIDAVLVYVQELKKSYAESILFFYDHSGGHVICGIWNPQTARRRWKVHIGYSTRCVKSEESAPDALVNKEAILAEIVRLGGSMVSHLQVNR